MSRAWMARCVGRAALTLGFSVHVAARAGEGSLPHHRWGVELDHGVGPYRSAYDTVIPGWAPGPVCDEHGHDRGPRAEWRRLNSHTPFVRTGLCRYPLFGFGGYIPAGPHDDCLYRTGRSPLKR